MQCQGRQHCPKWHPCHTAGKTPLLSGTTCITCTCTMHAAHICCTCNTGNLDETGSSCSCHTSSPEECPGIEVCDIPCHTCAATKIWPCPHGTKMPDPRDLGTVDPDCPWTLIAIHRRTHPQPTGVVNHCVIYSQKGGCRMIASYKECSH